MQLPPSPPEEKYSPIVYHFVHTRQRISLRYLEASNRAAIDIPPLFGSGNIESMFGPDHKQARAYQTRQRTWKRHGETCPFDAMGNRGENEAITKG